MEDPGAPKEIDALLIDSGALNPKPVDGCMLVEGTFGDLCWPTDGVAAIDGCLAEDMKEFGAADVDKPKGLPDFTKIFLIIMYLPNKNY